MNTKEQFIEIGEYAAAGLFEDLDRSVFYRKSKALRRYWENCSIPECDGRPLYPSGKLDMSVNIRPDFMMGFVMDPAFPETQPELGKTLPEYSLISEMKCIGEGLTPRIIAEIGDVRRFHNKHSLIAYAGIDAPPYQSGSYNATERHITKRGNKYLRKVIFEVCLS